MVFTPYVDPGGRRNGVAAFKADDIAIADVTAGARGNVELASRCAKGSRYFCGGAAGSPGSLAHPEGSKIHRIETRHGSFEPSQLGQLGIV
jgi:hypothetical protein